MVHRIIALVLAVTCAIAPAAWAVERVTIAADADACCCDGACPCPPIDCAPPPAAPVSATPTSATTIEQRATAARPRARVARLEFEHLLSAPRREPALPIRATSVDRIAPTASVALFQAHCSLLI